jgi:ribosomal protein S17E
LSSLDHYIVPYVAGYLTRLYAKLKNSGSGL